MIAALERRDSDAMRTILVAHLSHKRDAVLELMRDGNLNVTTVIR